MIWICPWSVQNSIPLEPRSPSQGSTATSGTMPSRGGSVHHLRKWTGRAVRGSSNNDSSQRCRQLIRPWGITRLSIVGCTPHEGGTTLVPMNKSETAGSQLRAHIGFHLPFVATDTNTVSLLTPIPTVAPLRSTFLLS